MRKSWVDRNYLPVLVAEIADLRRDRISSATGWASSIFPDKEKRGEADRKKKKKTLHSLISLPVSEFPFGLGWGAKAKKKKVFLTTFLTNSIYKVQDSSCCHRL